MKQHRTTRRPQELSQGTMADVAFLLLIFFFIATQIFDEKGLPMELPPYEANTRNATGLPDIRILINAEDAILVNGREASPGDLQTTLEEAAGRSSYLETGRYEKPTIELEFSAAATYRRYLHVYNTILLVFGALWDDAAQREYGARYDALGPVEKNRIRETYGFKMSEKEIAPN